eukprot:6179264-Pleurochrysis_carterae.AAC.5
MSWQSQPGAGKGTVARKTHQGTSLLQCGQVYNHTQSPRTVIVRERAGQEEQLIKLKSLYTHVRERLCNHEGIPPLTGFVRGTRPAAYGLYFDTRYFFGRFSATCVWADLTSAMIAASNESRVGIGWVSDLSSPKTILYARKSA